MITKIKTKMSVSEIALSFCCLMLAVSRTDASGIEKLLGIGPYAPEKMKPTGDELYERMQFERDMNYNGNSGWMVYGMPDGTMTTCFFIVVSYIMYMLIALMMKSEKEQTENNPATRALLEGHQFKDNLIPGKLRDLYEKDINFVHSTPLKPPVPQSQEQPLVEKPTIPEAECVSADLSQPITTEEQSSQGSGVMVL